MKAKGGQRSQLNGVKTSAFNVQRLAFSVQPFSVQRSSDLAFSLSVFSHPRNPYLLRNLRMRSQFFEKQKHFYRFRTRNMNPDR